MMTHNRKLWLLVAILTALWLFVFIVRPLMAQGYDPDPRHNWMGPQRFDDRRLPSTSFCPDCGYPRYQPRYRFPYEDFTPRGRPFIPYYPGSPYTPQHYPRYPY